MRFRDRLRLWWRARRRRRAAKKLAHAPLREFVYLDKVSVYSLIAARRGPLATEFTETESSSLTSELGGSFGASGGLAKAEVDSRVAAREARGSQVVRKSIEQATFKDLFEYEQDKMAIRATGNAVDPPPVESADELARFAGKPPKRHLVSDKALRRGELLELEVELGSEAVFRASTVMSTMLEFFDENPELIASLDRAALGQGEMAGRILRRMLAGLVPIRGRVRHWRRVVFDDREWLASDEILDGIPDLSALDPRPVDVVGVAEADLFWKDLRRVLFADAEYFVMCRLARSGMQATWSPVKLVEVLKSVFPGMGQMVEELGESFLEGMREGAAASANGDPNASRRAALEFARRISPPGSEGWSEEELEASGGLSRDLATLGTPEARRAALKPIVEFVETRTGTPVPAEEVARHRFEVLREFDLIAELPVEHELRSPDIRTGSNARLLDTEIVAIYW